ncbi:hypothetical protein LZ198_11690 [Myxococcus sp. K15C18031901]|uniref:hypothetical protein n=1 Tax=Myxococcus dinghuensis TaxID=2906761 RepID=UPI0020A7BA7F|nr:hypothetical protein [Myxococcus dinghuensis]MCP3099532.1 hypothetical protein [Myxococcus dinghuensis]
MTSVSFGGCIFSITAYPQSGVTPPAYDAKLIRQPIPSCPYGGGLVTLGTSVILEPSRTVAGNSLGVATAFTKKSSVSGSSPTTVTVQHVDPATLAILRTATIAVYLGAGNVESATVAVEADGTTVTVSGSKTGVIYGETGSGSHYTVTYPDFFTSTTPPTVAAFP